MQLIQIETFSENNRLLEKIANLALEQRIAAYCNVTPINTMVYLDKGMKRRTAGYRLAITTKEEYKASVVRLILDNQTTEIPRIFALTAEAMTPETERLITENLR